MIPRLYELFTGENYLAGLLRPCWGLRYVMRLRFGKIGILTRRVIKILRSHDQQKTVA